MVEEAIAQRHASGDLDGDYPRYAWVRIDGCTYEARLSNSGLGQYKGYPIEDYEAPRWLT